MTGKDFQEKHARNLKAASDEIRKGAEAVTVAPGVKAAEQRKAWETKMASKEVQDKWANNVRKVSLDDWKKDMIEKGVGRISAGLDRSADKIAAFGDKLISFEKSAKAEFDKIHPLTIDESADKMVKWIKKMHEFKK